MIKPLPGDNIKPRPQEVSDMLPIASLLAVTAFIVLMRLLWLNWRPGRAVTVATIAALVLIISLGILAATGRLPWIAAIGAAALPFLRRGTGLLRYLPWLRQLFGRSQHSSKDDQRRQPPGSGTVSRAQALEILGLSGSPDRDQIIAAHRRLMQKVHPDRGGSNYLAQQLNEAKRILLKTN
jgi:DnaJ family protein C protein 19